MSHPHPTTEHTGVPDVSTHTTDCVQGAVDDAEQRLAMARAQGDEPSAVYAQLLLKAATEELARRGA